MKKTFVLAVAFSLIFFASCTVKNTNTQEINTGVQEEKKVIEELTEEITLYYADKDATGLYSEVRTVPADKANDASFVLEELLKGTDKDNLVNSIPKDTKINSCTVENGLCTIDLSSEFVSNQGTANEQMAIYSVVNTLCLLDGIDEVAFLIDGEKVVIFGSYIFDEPFSADEQIVR